MNCQAKSVGAGGLGDVQLFADLYNFLDQHPNEIVPVTKVSEVRQAHQQDKIGLVFAWQSANELAEARGEPPPTALRAFYHLGIRIIGISYQVSNIFGGGVLDPEIGLTQAGRRLVEEIHTLGLVLDIGGHASEKTSFDAIEMSSETPVISSHTNVAAIVNNIRCISDRLMEAIAKTGGVIGISAISDYHVRDRKDAHIPRSPHATLEQHLDQFEYVRKLVGSRPRWLGARLRRRPGGATGGGGGRPLHDSENHGRRAPLAFRQRLRRYHRAPERNARL